MQKTVAAILSDASARQSERVTEKLSAEFSAGLPWFNLTDES